MAAMTELPRVPRVGVVLRPEWPTEQLRGFPAAAEAAGLDDVWLWEDCFKQGGLTAAAIALANTSSLRIGLGLMPVPLRNPALAAMEVATLARLFPRRFVPAAGHGVLSWMEQVGARASSSMTLLREWVAAVRALLGGETVTVSGTYINLTGVTLDWPPAAVPPLLVGARGPKTLALADAGISPDGVRRAVGTAAARRPHEVVVYLLCGAAPDSTERIEAELRESPEPFSARAAVGSPAQVASAVRAFGQAGATTVVLQPTVDDPNIAATLALAAAAKTALHGGG